MATIPNQGGTGTFTLTTQGGCSWTVTSDSTWLTAAVTSGNGSASIRFTAAECASKRSRLGKLTAAGQVGTVKQEGVKPGAPKNPRLVEIDPE